MSGGKVGISLRLCYVSVLQSGDFCLVMSSEKTSYEFGVQ